MNHQRRPSFSFSFSKEKIFHDLENIYLDSLKYSENLKSKFKSDMDILSLELHKTDQINRHFNEKLLNQFNLLNNNEALILEKTRIERNRSKDELEKIAQDRSKSFQEVVSPMTDLSDISKIGNQKNEIRNQKLFCDSDNKFQEKFKFNDVADNSTLSEKSNLNSTVTKLPSSTSKSAHWDDDPVSYFSSVNIKSIYPQICQKYINFYKDFKKKFESAASGISGSNQKKEELGLRMKIHKRIGQISKSLLQSSELNQILASTKANESSFAYLYCINLISAKFIEQGELQISLYMPSSYFISLTCMKVCLNDDVFMKVFIGRLMSDCIFTRGEMPVYEKQMNLDEYLVQLGCCKNSSTGVVESSENWIEKLMGVFGLFIALLQSPVSDSSETNLFDPELAWLWLSFIISIPPSYFTPLLLSTFLEICGYGMYMIFKNQFMKILEYIRSKYLPNLIILKDRESKLSIQGITRLEIYLKQVFQQNKGRILETPERQIT